MLIARLRALLVLCIFFGVSAVAIAADDETLSKATGLVKSNDFKAAYELLEPLESERAGDVNYDYLFGVAAVESGNVTRGVFALERVLATNPNHLDARAVIAKAYFKLGESETSKAEFRHVLDQQPAKEVTDAINKYMTAIDKSLGLTTTFGAYLDFGLGYDSNVNSATSSSTVAVPFFGGAIFNLGNGAREQSDTFMSISGGASFRQPITKNLTAFGAVNGNTRVNGSENAFDTSFLDFNGGLKYKRFIDTYTIAAQESSFDLDGESFRRVRGGTAQWQRDLDERNQVSVFGQYGNITYAGNSFRNANRYVTGASWGHVFAGDRSPVLFLSAYLGKENAKDSQADFLDNKLYGLRVGGQFTINPKLVAYGGASYEYRDYADTDPFFLRTRRDDQYDFNVGLRYLPGYNWTIRPQISYLKNDSNILINDFDRTMVSINFRHDFSW